MDFYAERREYACGIVDINLKLVDVNRFLLELLDSFISVQIQHFVAENDKSKIEKMFDDAKNGKNSYGIIHYICNSNKKKKEYKTYLTEIIFDEKEQKYCMILKDMIQIQKNIDIKHEKNAIYMNLLEIEQNILFVYNQKTNIINIFWITDNKEHYLVNEDLDKWKKRMLEEGRIGQNSIKIFENMCIKIAECKEDIKMMLDTKIISDDLYDSNIVQGKIIVDKYNLKKMVGNWNIYNPVAQSVLKNYAADTYTDALTGLLNKRAITMYAKEMLEKCDIQDEKKITLGIIDVDFFKDVNDNYGHMFGDDILKHVANYIYDGVNGKGMAGRIGGDEFMIILENCIDEAEMRNVLRAIKFNISSLYELRMNKTKLGCSIGAASYPTDAKNYDDLFNTADKALYIAKSKGRNRYIIYDEEKHGSINNKINTGESSIVIRKDITLEISKYIGKIFEIQSINTFNEFMYFLMSSYDIDRISIFELNVRDKPIYERKNADYPKGNIEMLDDLQEEKKDNYLFVDNTYYYQYNNIEVYEKFRKIRTLSTYMYFTNRDRVVVFDRCMKQHSWSKSEIKMLTCINNVMSNYIAGI